MQYKRLGRQTVEFANPPVISACANIGGQQEGLGPLRDWFDELDDDSFFGEKTWEKAESVMQKRVLRRCLERAGLKPEDVDVVFAGDLLNQCIGSSFGLRDFGIPFYGVYGACSTIGEALSLAAMTLEGGFARHCACISSSHFCAAERQYRMPMPYGSQRPPTAQWTATAAGCTILTAAPENSSSDTVPQNSPENTGENSPDTMPENTGENSPDNVPENTADTMPQNSPDSATQNTPCITHITCGKIVDKGICDAANMGAAMAPAAYDTLSAFFRETRTKPQHYDRIITGDLGQLGHDILRDMFARDGVEFGDRLNDCGLMLYDREEQDMHAGGSGAGCSASVLNGYLLEQIRRGVWKRIVFAPTGALFSPTSGFQGESVPGICHAVCLSASPQ